MKSITISKDNESKRLNRFLFSYFNNATEGFIYKMLRKKNIVLNDKKASGNEILKEGDVVSVYFSDETYEKFKSSNDTRFDNIDLDENMVLDKSDIVYEDENIIVINKKQGILSQKSKKDDISINELALNYLYIKGEASGESLKSFVPSITNRLDRNTGGLLIFAKNHKIAMAISKMFSENKIDRYYKALCFGDAKFVFNDKESVIVSSDYKKDEKENKAIISNTMFIEASDITSEISKSKIVTRFKILNSNKETSEIEAKLETGKSHQIRAQLSNLGLPIVGDTKYIDRDTVNKNLIESFKSKGIKHQVLNAYKIIFNTFEDEELSYLNNKEFKI